MDYCIPRADDFPGFQVANLVTACTHNDLGVKGCGEAGAIASPPALINAVVNHLHHSGKRHHNAGKPKSLAQIQDAQTKAAE